MGSHSSLESLSQSKFNQHMLDAEEHLKAGRYYRAAGCFSMASVYQADSPLALAGRGHALFAAGEYVSSALFLSRALAISPEYLQMKVDLAAILGDENKLADRIADIEQWLARSGSSQLQFLLGYVYYRMGQLLRAKQAIDAAFEKTPQSPAVQAMKITIDNMIMQR
jgi:tetratricopeptide (TPR) repeat protein